MWPCALPATGLQPSPPPNGGLAPRACFRRAGSWRKIMDEKYTKSVLIRIKPTQLEQFQRRSKLAGKSVSEWLRDLGAAAECRNPECPVGCPDSHTLPMCDEDAIAMGLEPFPRNYTKEEEGKRDAARKIIESVQAAVPGAKIGGIDIKAILNSPQVVEASERGKQQAEANNRAYEAAFSGREEGPTFPEDTPEEPEETSTVMLATHGPFEVENPRTAVFLGTIPSDTPEEPVRSWSEEFVRFRKMGDFGADALAEATEHIKKWPKGFKTWNEQKQVAWLDEKYPLTDSKGDGW